MAATDVTIRKRKIKRRSGRKGASPRLKQGTAVLVLLLIGWLSWGHVRAGILPLFIDYYEVETGTVAKELLVDKALVVREETVLFAPQSGTIKRLVPEGQRVAEGEPVAQVYSSYGGSQPVVAVRAGVVSYHTDGLERVLSPKTVATLKPEQLARIAPDLRETVEDGPVEKGAPVAKIVDNLQPFTVRLDFDVDYLASFPTPGKSIDLQFGETRCRGKVLQVTAQGVTAQALLELHREELLLTRELSLKLVLASKKGVKIPNEALVIIDDNPGVYKDTTNGNQWVPVTVQLQNEEYSIVEGLARGDRVVVNPRLLHPNDNS